MCSSPKSTYAVFILGLYLVVATANLAEARQYSMSLDGWYRVIFETDNPLEMNYKESRVITMIYSINRLNLPKEKADSITFHFRTVTRLPENHRILTTSNGDTNAEYKFPMKQLIANEFKQTINITLEATYIGHATLELWALSFSNDTFSRTFPISVGPEAVLLVKIKQTAGAWDHVFVASVSLLLLISYINLGGQLDTENIRDIIKNPKTLILGLLISIIVMPVMTWFFAKWLLANHMIYRVGAFIFAAGPAATASTLWAVMLDADKELSVGLQIASNLAGLITMPVLLYLMEVAVAHEGSEYLIKVPYTRLVYGLLMIVVALAIGRYAIASNENVQRISRKLFKPLTFSILLFIIIFSSILYWHIYSMFSWTITLTSLLITISTYLISGLLGYLINRNRDCSFAISIGSTYKNSGIAFAVLLVALGAPDMYIAFVPCLTQVLTTSFLLYIFYSFYMLINRYKRRGQLEPIQATRSDVEGAPVSALADVQPTLNTGELGKSPKAIKKPKEQRSNSNASAKSDKEAGDGPQEQEEMVAMNVTDSVPGSPASLKGTRSQEATSANETDDKNKTEV